MKIFNVLQLRNLKCGGFRICFFSDWSSHVAMCAVGVLFRDLPYLLELGFFFQIFRVPWQLYPRVQLGREAGTVHQQRLSHGNGSEPADHLRWKTDCQQHP